MKKTLILLMVALAVAGALVLKKDKGPAVLDRTPQAAVANATEAAGSSPEAAAPAQLPKLLDLGAGKCIPCKMMAPILEELKKEYAGKMEVEFIDVWQNPDAGKAYGVEMIPTQIFYDAEGRERFRHTGFYGKEDILGKWKELGVDLEDRERK